MGNLLEVKPILTIRSGKLDLMERGHTQRKAWARVIELVGQAAQGRPVERLGVIHVRAPEQT